MCRGAAQDILGKDVDEKSVGFQGGRHLGINFKFIRNYCIEVWREASSQVAQWVKNQPANVGDASSIPGSRRSPGERNGNPIQCSCLENSMDSGAWQATVHGVTKSWTRLCYRAHMERSREQRQEMVVGIPPTPPFLQDAQKGPTPYPKQKDIARSTPSYLALLSLVTEDSWLWLQKY